MFGPMYLRRDVDTVAYAKVKGPERALLQYAAELLEELFNRAAVLDAVKARAGLLYNDKTERLPALEDLEAALEVFLVDVSEARIRARRARLVAGSGVYHEPVCSASMEDEKSLKEIGGALIPE